MHNLNMNATREFCPYNGKDFQDNFDFHSNRFYIISTFCSAVGIILAPPIVLINGLVVITIIRNTVFHNPANILICLLGVADFLVGFIFLPVQTAWMLNYDINKSCFFYGVVVASSWTFCGASFLTMVAVSAERYLALFLHLKYSTLITPTKLALTGILIWLMSISTAIIFLISYIELATYLTVGVLTPGLNLILFTYYRIFKLVRHHQVQIRSQQVSDNDAAAAESARQRKLAITMAYVTCTTLVCYAPVGVATFIMIIDGKKVYVIESMILTVTLNTLSSLFNPLIYCSRSNDLRKSAIAMLCNVFRCHR